MTAAEQLRLAAETCRAASHPSETSLLLAGLLDTIADDCGTSSLAYKSALALAEHINGRTSNG